VSEVLAQVAYNIMEKDFDYQNLPENDIYELCYEEFEEFLSSKQ
jgi:hypothetical protein